MSLSISEKKLCPCCNESSWSRLKIKFMNDYLICKKCSFNLQEISEDLSENDFFKIQQAHYFSDSSMFDSKLMIDIENEVNDVRLKKVKQYLKHPKNTLEIGPGSGSFAISLKQIASSVTLIEDSKKLSERLKNLTECNVINMPFSDFHKEKEFDAVFSFHVLEHVDEVKDHLLHIRSILNDEGLLFLSTPNADSVQHRLPFALSPNFDSAHMCVFSLESIRLILKKTGFELIELNTPEYSIIWLRVLSKILRRILGNSETETAGKHISNESIISISIFHLFKFLSFPLRKIQERFHNGNEIFIVAKKTDLFS